MWWSRPARTTGDSSAGISGFECPIAAHGPPCASPGDSSAGISGFECGRCRRWRLVARRVLERPGGAITGAVRGHGQNHDGQIAPHRLFNFPEVHLARQLIRINACILQNFHNKFGASGGPAQALGHVKYPEPPEEFVEAIRERTGAAFSRSHLYALLAAPGLSPKSVTLHHVNRATGRAVLQCQRRLRKRLARSRRGGSRPS